MAQVGADAVDARVDPTGPARGRRGRVLAPVVSDAMSGRYAIFDLDGTLVDSDAALVAPFVALGVEPEAITFGHVLADECARLGIAVDDYLAAYDEGAVMPFPGVEAMLGRLDEWAVCSNKHATAGRAELLRLGWTPRVALFSDAFDGPKRLGPVLELLGRTGDDVVFVGDTDHDRACAQAIGAPFLLAGWNPRARPRQGDVVLDDPAEVLDHLG
jgi:HAD superfamily hydrolase (TIGR01549 family)